MNFETNQPFDQQLANLLAIIIMSQSKIEELKKKLAGNQQFHTRLIFERMDYRKKGQITPQDILYSLSIQKNLGKINLQGCQMLCRKYTVSGTLTYQQLLSLITPKTDKSLAQRVLLRTSKRGSTLPLYLWNNFSQLLTSLISLTYITQILRKKIQNCTQLNHLQMIQFFRKCLKNKSQIYNFCNKINRQYNNNNNNNGQYQYQQYDFTIDDIKYLSNHIHSKNQIQQFTDQDIKQLICPLDMNYQKTIYQMSSYYQIIKLQKQKILNNQFYQQTKNQQFNKNNKNYNFLKSNYQSFYPINNARKTKLNYNYNYNINTNNNNYNNNNNNRYQTAQKQYNQNNYNYNQQQQNQQRIQPQQPPYININTNPNPKIPSPSYPPSYRHNKPSYQNNIMIIQRSNNNNGQQGYLDNFIKPIQYSSGYGYINNSRRDQIQLNKFIGAYGYAHGYTNGNNRNSYQRFQDQLPQNLDSSKNSAFVQY